jgi:hypothetical protein
MKTLEEIAEYFGTDKSSIRHDYTREYDKLFTSFRFEEFHMLEIGVLNGNSARMFGEYFPNAIVHMLDCVDKLDVLGDDFIFHLGDQGNRADLKRIMREIGHDLWLVLDDGSHIAEHQIISFEEIWPYLAVGGMYIIEDLHVAYSKTGDSKAVEYFFHKVHQLHKNEHKRKRRKIDIESINFLRDRVVIKKKEA